MPWVYPLEFRDAALGEWQRHAPIPRAGDGDRAAIGSLVQRILDLKGGSGVHDKGGVWGIGPDFALLRKKQDRDGFELKLTDCLRKRITPIPTSLTISFVEIEWKMVCRIEVPPEPRPHFLDEKQLYIRFGNSTIELTGRDMSDWLEKRRAAP